MSRGADSPAGESPESAEKTRTRGLLRVPPIVAHVVVTIAVLVGLVQFFRTESWLWFLLLPLSDLVLYGPGGADQAQ